MADDRDWLDELYAEGREEPPAALDAAILAAARDNAKRPWYRNLRYLTTVATAASFVLAAMIVYYAPEDGQPARPARDAAPVSTTPMPATDRREADAPVAAQPPSPAGPPERKTLTAGETVAAKAKVESLTDALAEEVSRPAEPAAAEGATADSAGRGLPTAETTQRQLQVPASLGQAANRTSAAAPSAAESAAAAETAEVLAALTASCGPAPGTEGSRTLEQDLLGWYLVVTGSGTTTYYRCADQAWRQIDAPVVSEQQPDSDHDQ